MKSHIDTIATWKTEDARDGLSDAERDMIPESPAGAIELTDEALGLIGSGGVPPVVKSCAWCSC